MTVGRWKAIPLPGCDPDPAHLTAAAGSNDDDAVMEHGQPVHPVAALFPLMSDEELDELASDIQTHGQIHPIILDQQGRLVDGRNRMLACMRAQITPKCETLPSSVDPAAFILSANIQRRQMTKGQIAMAVAKVRRLESMDLRSAARAAQISKTLVGEAALVIEYAPELVDAVIHGAAQLHEAYNAARERRDHATSREQQMLRLRAEAPDLAELVAEERMTIPEGMQVLSGRKKELRQRRETTTRNLSTALLYLDPGAQTPLEAAQRVALDLDFDYAKSMPGHEITAERVKACMDVLAALMDLLGMELSFLKGDIDGAATKAERSSPA